MNINQLKHTVGNIGIWVNVKEERTGFLVQDRGDALIISLTIDQADQIVNAMNDAINEIVDNNLRKEKGGIDGEKKYNA